MFISLDGNWLTNFSQRKINLFWKTDVLAFCTRNLSVCLVKGPTGLQLKISLTLATMYISYIVHGVTVCAGPR